MPRETTHTVRDVRASRGELSFDVDVCDIQRTLWFKTDAPVTPNADAVLATCLLPAVLWGGTLDIDAPISPRLLRSQAEFQATQRMWSRGWSYGLLPLGEIEVRAPARTPAQPAAGRGVATFFSGGVDSWSVRAAATDRTAARSDSIARLTTRSAPGGPAVATRWYRSRTCRPRFNNRR